MIGSGAAKVATGVGTLIRETAAKTVDAAGNTVNALRGIDAKKMRAMFISKMIKAGIVDPNEQALLLANVHSETGGFTRIGDEDLRYSVKRLKELRPDIKKLRNASDAEIEAAVAGGREKIAELMYGGRGGNTAAGEGFKYRGRGMLQLTFKGNYAQLSKAVKQDLVNNPDLVANDPNVAADTAIQYWLKRVDRKAAQRGDVDRVALQVNGGKIGITERHKNFAMYQKLITDGGLKQLDYDGQIGSAALANDAAKNVTSAGKPAPIPEPKTTASANTPDAKVASTGAAAPKAAASAALDKPKAVVSGAAAPSDSGEAVVKSTQPNTAKVAAAAVAAPPATKAVDDAGGESTYVPTSPSNNAASVMPVSTAADPSTRRVVSDESVIPVDIMAQKAKEQQEAAAMMAEKRRQDALDTTSTGMDAAVMLMKEQLRVMTSMDTNLAKIERHMAAMAKSAGTPQAPAQQRQTPSAPPNLKLVQNNPTVEPTQPPVSVSRNS